MLSVLLTKPTKVKKKRFLCCGGPWDGQYIKLSYESSPRTLEFGVPSFANGKRGMYTAHPELCDAVEWEFV